MIRDLFKSILALVLSPVLFVGNFLILVIFAMYVGVRHLLWDLNLVKDVEAGRPGYRPIQNRRVVYRNPLGAAVTIIVLVVMIASIVRWF
ncbi:hypothetical protein K3725_09660 [Leisingera sp. S132]|uniref:hypothetical protein n=1 Tax=Leisingera sp. S132 TaxID=2867016 RepID=UPI0021A8BD5A|nr:hypothetical protein [Leisingera sp. S132]UWQ77590.1 hypothetical protein K3725_09660 [Leisingera sp. S132]